MGNLNLSNGMSFNVVGQLEISNYRTFGEKQKLGRKQVRSNTHNGFDHSSYYQGSGNKKNLELTQEQAQLLKKIANSDGNADLSWMDIHAINIKNPKALGLDDNYVIRKDEATGVLDIYKNIKGKLETFLHLDFDTEKEKEARKMARGMYQGGHYLAQELYDDHISGPSINSKTLTHINELNDRDFMKMMRSYCNNAVSVGEYFSGSFSGDAGHRRVSPDGSMSIEFNKNGLIKDLQEEWFMGKSDVLPIIKRTMDLLPKKIKQQSDYSRLETLYNEVLNGDVKFNGDSANEFDELLIMVLGGKTSHYADHFTPEE